MESAFPVFPAFYPLYPFYPFYYSTPAIQLPLASQLAPADSGEHPAEFARRHLVRQHRGGSPVSESLWDARVMPQPHAARIQSRECDGPVAYLRLYLPPSRHSPRREIHMASPRAFAAVAALLFLIPVTCHARDGVRALHGETSQ
jgi:hypothetical protein